MNNSVQPDKPVIVSCKECLKQIPHSEAKMEEAGDYVLYFCGLDCYKIWRERCDREGKQGSS